MIFIDETNLIRKNKIKTNIKNFIKIICDIIFKSIKNIKNKYV